MKLYFLYSSAEDKIITGLKGIKGYKTEGIAKSVLKNRFNNLEGYRVVEVELK